MLTLPPPFCPLALYPPLGSCGLALSDSSPAPHLWGLGCRGAGEAKVLWERAHPSGTAAHTEWAVNRLSEGTPWWSPHSYRTVSVPVLLHSLCVPCLGHPQLPHMPLHFLLRCSVQFSSVQLLSCVRLFATPWTAACQAPLSAINSWSLLKLMSIQSVTPSNHFILCRPLLLPPSLFPSIKVFSSESVSCIRWPKYWSFSFSISPSNEYSGLISFRMDWLDLLAVQFV